MAIKAKKVTITPRLRRKFRIRKKLSGTNARPRLSVFRSAKFCYGQLVSDETGVTLASASTKEKDVIDAIAKIEKEGIHSDGASPKGVLAAKALGFVIAQRAKEKSIENAVFDRNGFLFHGRIKAIADGAREGGLNI